MLCNGIHIPLENSLFHFIHVGNIHIGERERIPNEYNFTYFDLDIIINLQ